jgi:hypothetical protein
MSERWKWLLVALVAFAIIRGALIVLANPSVLGFGQ